MSPQARRQQAAEPDPQDGMFDQVIDNELLIAALERRHAAKGKLAQPQKAYKEADEAVKGIITTLELDPTAVVRAGRFRIKSRVVEPGHREFDVGGSTTLTISLIAD